MNIFIIPSWYPSESNPIYGIFTQEQARLIAREKPEFQVGVSLWGQGVDDLMLPALSPASLVKLFGTHSEKVNMLQPNLAEYFSPAFTWTRRFRKGNIEGIIEANLNNLEKHIQKFGKPDIICAHASYPASIVAKRISKKFSIPYTVTIYMSPFPFDEFLSRNGSINKIVEEPLKQADLLLCSCSALEKRLFEFGFSNTAVVPLPVDADFFVPGQTVDAKKVQMLALGRVVEQKGFDLLLKAVSKIETPFELRIGGDGDMRAKYEVLSKQLKLTDKVVWLGLLDKNQTLQEMQNCDFFVLSSRHETFGLVQVEAMLCGKPVVATKCGGPEDIVTNETGYLCENLDVEDLREKIELMIKKHKSFSSEKIRKHAKAKFGQSAWLTQIEALFRGLV
ncbi:glycosyltransferase [Ekhidna sp.]|uniref:glycosyltransferase n=1 Tax=Ekhidna sp. TaxID=2608089 RepID=UPI003297C5C9